MITHTIHPDSPEKNLTWELENEETAITEYQNLLQEYILLVMTSLHLDTLATETRKKVINNANDICLEDIAHSRQRVLILEKPEVIEALTPELNKAIAKKSSGDTIKTIKACVLFPGDAGAAYIVKKYRLGKSEMDRGFTKAFVGLKSVSLPDGFPLE